jgi:FlaA1/EpsC-like NDP-sugar epimerase
MFPHLAFDARRRLAYAQESWNAGRGEPGMNRSVERFRGLSRTMQIVAGVIVGAMVLVLLWAFFTSELGRTVALVCCGGVILLVIVGVMSESGMRRR